jgi:hypothetical protein
MSTHKPDTSAYLRWIVASEYYDGAMAGVGERVTDGAAVWFRAVAWDHEQWQRVFAVTVVEPVLVERLIRDLEKVDQRRTPFWLPGPTSATPDVQMDWGDIADAALRSERWWLVEAHDLIEASTERQAMPADVPRLAANVRAGTVLGVSGPSLMDSVLQQIRP